MATAKKSSARKKTARSRKTAPAKVGAVEERRRIVKDAKEQPSYFVSASVKDLNFVHTGCRVLDMVFGGGYVLGRFANLVGDKSTGKTLLATEAMVNFKHDYPEGRVRYAESEAAYDRKYAEAMGMPVESVDFAENINTVEDFFEDIEKVCSVATSKKPMLYILDSLDALSDREEMKRSIDKGSYGVRKPAVMSELFRKFVRKLEASHVCLIIISQIRDKIGVTFGETKTRTGGKAMDFYASQVVWLSEVEKLKRMVGGIERVVGIKVAAYCKKNKIGMPFRKCSFPLIFGYGIDDLTANVEWLIENKKSHRLKELGMSEAGYKVRITNLRNTGGEETYAIREALDKMIEDEWANVETTFLPKARKYKAT